MRLLIRVLAGVVLAATAATADLAADSADPEGRTILAEIAAGELARAEERTIRMIAREEGRTDCSRSALAGRVETLAESFYATGTSDGANAAERLFSRALALRESEPGRDEPGLASLLHALSGLHFNRGQLEKAEVEERRALAIRERIFPPGDPIVAESRRDLALIYLAEGRLAESAPLLTDAVRAIEASAPPDWTVVAVGRNYLAELYRVQGRHEAAAAVLEDLVRDALEKLGEGHPQYPYFLNNLAGIYRDQERYDESETLLRRSLAIRKAAGQPDDGAVARATLNLAELFRAQGKYTDAEPLYSEALALATKSAGEGSTELFEFINQFAVLFRDQGRLDAAEPRFREALTLAERALGAGNLLVARSRFDLAELLRARGRCAEADADYARALEVRESILGTTHPDVAEVLTARSHCRPTDAEGSKRALADVDRALAILGASESYPSIEIDALALRAELVRAKDPARARRDLSAAIDVVERTRPHRGGGEAVRATFFGRHRPLYQRLVRWEVEEGHPEKALAVAERGRARVLMDQLEAAHVGEAATQSAELRARLAAARAELAEARQRLEFEQTRPDATLGQRIERVKALEARLDAAGRTLRGLWDESRNASSGWRRAVEPQPTTIEALRTSVVPASGLLLLYELGSDGSWLFVVPPAPAAVEAIPLRIGARDGAALGVSAGALTDKKLASVLTGRRGLLTAMAAPSAVPSHGSGGLSTPNDTGESKLGALFRVLVPPSLWPRIAGVSEVLLVPDGPLFLLPFEALVVKAGPDAGSTRYWLDDGPVIRYAPSATVIAQLNGRPAGRAAASTTRPAALTVSDPVFAPDRPAPGVAAQSTTTPVADGDGDSDRPSRRTLSIKSFSNLPRLPGTAQESENVRAALADVAELVALQGESAREPAVRAALPGKRYVHLATHGLVDQDRDNMFAALALTPPPVGTAPSGDDDGFLELFEIYDLTLDCDLAVLSACASNAGSVITGEGVFALSRGFLVAGARRVVASQWPVDDSSTAELIGELFRRIAVSDRNGEAIDAARALRDAKRRIRLDPVWADPFYWAPFVLTGVR